VSGSRGPPTYVGLAKEEAEALARAMEQAAWMRPLPPANEHERLRAEAEGALFIVWRSGKLSYQGPKARPLLEEFARAAGLAPDGGPTEAGSDEAGKGEWLGPLVVAAVAVRPEQRLRLRLDGVRDSKDLGGPVRHALAQRIRDHAAACNVVSIGPRRFNELWAEMHARGETLNDLLWWAHRTALAPVLQAVGPDAAGAGLRVVLDEFDRTRQAARMLGEMPPRAVVEQRPRAEDALAVAAASVLARAERDAQVEALAARWDLPAGLLPAQAMDHPQAREFAKVAYLRPGTGP
jgi:ribonuclease HIII